MIRCRSSLVSMKFLRFCHQNFLQLQLKKAWKWIKWFLKTIWKTVTGVLNLRLVACTTIIERKFKSHMLISLKTEQPLWNAEWLILTMSGIDQALQHLYHMVILRIVRWTSSLKNREQLPKQSIIHWPNSLVLTCRTQLSICLRHQFQISKWSKPYLRIQISPLTIERIRRYSLENRLKFNLLSLSSQ